MHINNDHKRCQKFPDMNTFNSNSVTKLQIFGINLLSNLKNFTTNDFNKRIKDFKTKFARLKI